MQALIDVILPVFLILGAGWAAARAGLFSEAAVDGLMRFAQGFAVPCLLFRGVARLDLSAAYDPGLMAAFYLGAFAAYLAGYLGARTFLARTPADALSIGFAAAFSNTLLLGLPITERAFGPGALDGNYAIISAHAPVLYALGITAMEYARSRGRPAPALARQIARAILSQPLVIGILAGLTANLTGLPLPGVLWSAVDMLVAAAIPAALFGLGGVLNRYRPAGDMRAILMVCVLSLVFHPTVTWGLGHLFGLSTAQMRSAVVTAAMAPGVNAYLYAHLYGAAQRVSASAVLIGTGFCILTAWGWLHILP
jgi:hypothetical protein